MEKTKAVKIGKITIGAGYPAALQTMLKTPLTDTKAVIAKIGQLKEIGCDIIRAAVPDMKNAACIKEIVSHTDVPFVADIHFDYRLAIESVKNGAAKLRINPGNIGGEKCIREVVACLKEYRIPVRIGVNGGSLEKDILAKHGAPTAQALYESALRSIGLFNRFGYDDIVVSIKSSDVAATVAANRLFAAAQNYPLHLGVTEAGAGTAGLVRSCVGIGALLLDGIGDTLRVSLTGPPEDEIDAAKQILSACNLHQEGIRVVSCPTCGRCRTDTLSVVESIRQKTADIKTVLTVAVMGCAVNGPGEAKEADIGIAFGNGNGVIFKQGKKYRAVKTKDAVDVLCDEIRALSGAGRDE